MQLKAKSKPAAGTPAQSFILPLTPLELFLLKLMFKATQPNSPDKF
jgi:hypothetical protein